MSNVTLAATFPKVVVNTTTGVVEVHSGLRDRVARAGLEAEEAARIAADANLQAAIEAEEAARIAADAGLADAIAGEAAARGALDESLATVAKSGSAADVAFTPAGGISASDVQAAIEEAAAMAGNGGGGGEGDGDMLAEVYDPQGIEADAFDPLNHHGADWRLAVTPFDFAEGVGVGNATKDTEALQAFATYITENNVGHARLAAKRGGESNFLVEEGITFGPAGGTIATRVLECNAIIRAVAAIEDIVHLRGFWHSKMLGRLEVLGTGGDTLSGNTCMHAIRLSRSAGASFGHLIGRNVRGWGVRNTGTNYHFASIEKVSASNCGAGGGTSGRIVTVNVTGFDKTGSGNSQLSVLTVDDPANIPSIEHDIRWGFVPVDRFPHKIREVDYDAGTISIFPYLDPEDEVPGEFQLVFGGGLRLGGQAAKTIVHSVDSVRNGTGLWLFGAAGQLISAYGSEFDAIHTALASDPGAAFGGATIDGWHGEADRVCQIVHVGQTPSAGHGSFINCLSSVSKSRIHSLNSRPSAGGRHGVNRYFPVALLINNELWSPQSNHDVRSDIETQSLTNYTLTNRPLPWAPSRRPHAATFTINLQDDPDYRRLKGSVPVDFILSGRGVRKGTFGGYNGTVVINALDDGKTINDSGFQSVEITGPEKPARYTAWLEDDGSGPNIWRVTIEELDVVGGSEATLVFPGDIDDLAVVFTRDPNSLTVEFDVATNADYYEYQISLAGSDAWGGEEVLEGSVDEGTFTGLIEGLASNEHYDVRVRGFNDNGPGAWSNIATGSTLIYPGDIDDLHIPVTTDTSALLRFTEPANASSYEWRYSLENADDWSTPEALTGSSSDGVFSGLAENGLTTNETYDFQARGMNDNGDGEWSNVATATLSDQAPGDIDDLVIIQSATTDASVTMAFTEPTEPAEATSFEYRFSLTGEDDWSSPATLSGTSQDGVFTGTVSSGLTEDETYDFQVRGVNIVENGEWSNIDTVKVNYPWQQIIDLADDDGWTSVYDPNNPNTRTLREGGGTHHYTEFADGLDNTGPYAQAAEASQPIRATALGGYHVMDMDSERFMSMPGTNLMDTVIVVGEPQENTAGSVFSHGTNNLVTPQLTRLRWRTGSDGISFLNFPTSQDGFNIYSMRRDGTALSAWRNGVASSDNPVTQAANGIHHLGRQTSGANYYNKRMALMVTASGTISLDAKVRMEALLGRLYRIELG
jgi:hypothetical protein